MPDDYWLQVRPFVELSCQTSYAENPFGIHRCRIAERTDSPSDFRSGR